MTEPSPIPPPQIAEPETAPAPSPIPIADPMQNGTSVDVEMKDDAPTEVSPSSLHSFNFTKLTTNAATHSTSIHPHTLTCARARSYLDA